MELDDCHKRMVFLEEQLRVAQRQTDRAMLLKLKKVRTGRGRGGGRERERERERAVQ